jgi:hypothetical protein
MKRILDYIFPGALLFGWVIATAYTLGLTLA